jgi:hypothetical protein
MLISISNQISGYPSYYRSLEISSARDLAEAMCSRVWSPIIWKGGKRNTDNFLFADYIGLDFDKPHLTLSDVSDRLKSLRIKALIGLTKSHQLPKNDEPACDRFRVVIPWSSRITDFKTYRQNLERLARVLPGDPSVKDGARIFQPCIRIHDFIDGSPYAWNAYQPEPKHNENVTDYFSRNGIIPRFLRDMINMPPGKGNRNLHCFKIAAAMSKFGFSESDCMAAVMACAVDLPEREKITAARSGFKAGKK